MQDNDKPRASSSWLNLVLAATFILLIWLPLLGNAFNLDTSTRLNENRFLAKRPGLNELKAGHIEVFFAECQSYFNDHFGFRSRLIAWSQGWKQIVYHESSLYHIVTGPNQWQFFGENHMIENCLGWLNFTPQQLAEWQALLEKRRDWLAQRHIQYLFVIAPEKQSIYPEELPAWLRNLQSVGLQTKTDQFVAYMRAHSTVPILDLRQPLIAAKRTAPTYLQHDSHWNLFGGFIACQTIVGHLQEFHDLPSLRLEDFTWTNAPLMGGDLISGEEEHNYFEFHPRKSLPALDSFISTNITPIWDIHQKAHVIDNESGPARTAVIFHDSFGLAWRNFLGFEFKQTIFLSDNREFNSEMILRDKPDVVVNEMVERFLDTYDPVELMAKDAL